MNRSNKKRKLEAEARQREQENAAAERKRVRKEVIYGLLAVADDLLPSFANHTDGIFKLEPGDLPTDPQPPAPSHHVESHACGYGSIGYQNENDIATWNACDCEDPANPWPARLPTDGPIDCNCYLCSGKPRVERGREPCEYFNHCCEDCHDRKTCTTIECKKEFT